jgi:hypothetical protein
MMMDLSFPHAWKAEILTERPLILPQRSFIYPAQAEEVERGALEVLVYPEASGVQPFLATCALGFRDPAVPSGVWSTPHRDWLCAVSGGYAYLIDTIAPQRFTMIPYRPVLQTLPVPAPEQPDAGCLLFVSHRSILAWGKAGQIWESERLSDEGVTVTAIEAGVLHGAGWQMQGDRETRFTLNLQTGKLIGRDS